MTLPNTEESTLAGSTLAAAIAASAACCPSTVAVIPFNFPPKAPNAVLLADTMYTGRARPAILPSQNCRDRKKLCKFQELSCWKCNQALAHLGGGSGVGRGCCLSEISTVEWPRWSLVLYLLTAHTHVGKLKKKLGF